VQRRAAQFIMGDYKRESIVTSILKLFKTFCKKERKMAQDIVIYSK
jgi:hypothetical protein